MPRVGFWLAASRPRLSAASDGCQQRAERAGAGHLRLGGRQRQLVQDVAHRHVEHWVEREKVPIMKAMSPGFRAVPGRFTGRQGRAVRSGAARSG